MMKRTHITIGVISTILAIRYLNLEPITCALGTIAATMTPDLDFKFHIKHRTITHSLLFLFISSLLFSVISTELSLSYFIGVNMHLIADSFTVMGIPLFYPFIKHRYGFKLIKTNSLIENIIFILLIFIAFTLVKD